jgi:hypothetical protein
MINEKAVLYQTILDRLNGIQEYMDTAESFKPLLNIAFEKLMIKIANQGFVELNNSNFDGVKKIVDQAREHINILPEGALERFNQLDTTYKDVLEKKEEEKKRKQFEPKPVVVVKPVVKPLPQQGMVQTSNLQDIINQLINTKSGDITEKKKLVANFLLALPSNMPPTQTVFDEMCNKVTNASGNIGNLSSYFLNTAEEIARLAYFNFNEPLEKLPSQIMSYKNKVNNFLIMNLKDIVGEKANVLTETVISGKLTWLSVKKSLTEWFNKVCDDVANNFYMFVKKGCEDQTIKEPARIFVAKDTKELLGKEKLDALIKKCPYKKIKN